MHRIAILVGKNTLIIVKAASAGCFYRLVIIAIAIECFVADTSGIFLLFHIVFPPTHCYIVLG